MPIKVKILDLENQLETPSPGYKFIAGNVYDGGVLYEKNSDGSIAPIGMPDVILSASSVAYMEMTGLTIGNRLGNPVYPSVLIGTFSFAHGVNVRAEVPYAYAQGDTTSALANYTHAEGKNTIASGAYAHVEGSETSGVGFYSHSEGANTATLGLGSHAEGFWSVAGASYSHAEGYDTDAYGQYSHTEGQDTFADAIGVHAEGLSTSGHGTYSHTEGHLTQTTSTGDYAHAEGLSTTASADYAHAEGTSSTASGVASHAEGSSTTASGIASHAEGSSTIASGNYAHSMGRYTLAQGLYSLTGGVGTNATTGAVLASGAGSFAFFYSDGTATIRGALANYTAVLGGTNNKVYDDGTYSNATNSVVVGGYTNVIYSSIDSGIFAGYDNYITPDVTATSRRENAIVGGRSLHMSTTFTANLYQNFMAGGYGNSVSANAGDVYQNTVIGGRGNVVLAQAYAHYQNTIIGGYGNTVSGTTATLCDSAIIGGYDSWVGKSYSAIVGGQRNDIFGEHGFMGGGWKNIVNSANYSTIIGGTGNTISYVPIIGTVNGSSIIGGCSNWLTGSESAIIAGDANVVSGDWSVAIGGYSNSVQGNGSSVLGGYSGTIASTSSNSVIVGGHGSQVSNSTNVVVLGGHDIYPNSSNYDDTVVANYLAVSTNISGIDPTEALLTVGSCYHGSGTAPVDTRSYGVKSWINSLGKTTGCAVMGTTNSSSAAYLGDPGTSRGWGGLGYFSSTGPLYAGVYGNKGTVGSSSYAGYFDGDIKVNGEVDILSWADKFTVDTTSFPYALSTHDGPCVVHMFYTSASEKLIYIHLVDSLVVDTVIGAVHSAGGSASYQSWVGMVPKGCYLRFTIEGGTPGFGPGEYMRLFVIPIGYFAV